MSSRAPLWAPKKARRATERGRKGARNCNRRPLDRVGRRPAAKKRPSRGAKLLFSTRLFRHLNLCLICNLATHEQRAFLPLLLPQLLLPLLLLLSVTALEWPSSSASSLASTSAFTSTSAPLAPLGPLPLLRRVQTKWPHPSRECQIWNAN